MFTCEERTDIGDRWPRECGGAGVPLMCDKGCSAQHSTACQLYGRYKPPHAAQMVLRLLSSGLNQSQAKRRQIPLHISLIPSRGELELEHRRAEGRLGTIT